MNHHEETRRYYDAIAQSSFEEWFDNPALLPALTDFIHKLPPEPKLLDIGCGTGGESQRLVKLGADVTGIDFSEKSIELARKNVPEATFHLMDILNMDFPAATFNGVLDAAVLFHFDESEQNGTLDKIISALKPQGKLLSFYPVGDYEGMQNRKVGGSDFRRYIRQRPLTDWIGQVKSRGFREYIIYDFTLGPFQCVEFKL